LFITVSNYIAVVTIHTVTYLTVRSGEYCKVEKLCLCANQLVFYTYLVNNTLSLKERPVAS
jgi:hypothetical protein